MENREEQKTGQETQKSKGGVCHQQGQVQIYS